MQKNDDIDKREEAFMDIDRMVNEGLGGGNVTEHNGKVEETTTNSMQEEESILDQINQSYTTKSD
ncbi:hypothetical protein [Longirhabdus pacifica]|uniref:hypothetical protein n=1 Tax=Longirhabdus pacifica TaxID=2305227 RepID=UPI00100928D7|nr:hypothetical protein [Longirhabdus pacifica]